jgi:serine/threonine-protein kinase
VQGGAHVGAYKLIEQIGAGGMGAVWLAEHAKLGRRAAVKMLHGEYTQRPEIVQRFFNEARAATAISDPGIVQVFDFGQEADGTAYIVMELLDGMGLDRRLREHGPLAPSDALRIIRQVAKSLGAAHAVGIVHRDLKPENIFLVKDDEVAGGERAKILDFGIAKLQGDTAGWRTNTSQVMGTPLYMSPEQCRGAGQVDQRTDVYSLGCVLFVLLCGRPPFWAEGSGELIAMHLREAPPAPSTFNVRVPPQVDRLVAKCLAKEPGERFLNGIEMANAVSEVLASIATTSRAETPVPQPALVPATSTTLSSSSGAIALPAQSPSAAAPARKPRGGVIAGIAAGVLVAAGVAVFVVTRRDPPEPPKTAESAGSAAATAPEPAPPPAPPAGNATAEGSATLVKGRDEIKTRMLQVINGFLRWSASHAGAPCPTAKDLAAVRLDDPWGHPMRITCVDQPPTQMIGIVSDGPDGVAGNRDDVESWTMPPDITEAIAGPRWTPKRAAPTSGGAKTGTAAKTGTGAKTGGTTPGDTDGDGIPDERTKN